MKAAVNLLFSSLLYHLCFATLAGTTSNSALEEVYAAAYNDAEGVLQLDATTLKSEPLGNLISSVTGNADIEMIEVDCIAELALNPIEEDGVIVDPSYFSCMGEVEIFERLNVQATFVVADLGIGELAMNIEIKAEYGLDKGLLEHFIQVEGDSFLDSVDVGDSVSGTISAGTAAFNYGLDNEFKVKPGIFLHAEAALLSGSVMFGIEESFEVDGMAMIMDLKFPLSEGFQFDLSSASGEIKLVAASVAINQYVEFAESEFSIKLTDFTSPVVDIKLKSTLVWTPDDASPVVFLVSGSWNSRMNAITLLGKLKRKWKNPAGIEWLSINEAKILAEFDFGEFKTLEVSGEGEFRIQDSNTIVFSAEIQAMEDFSQFFFITTLEVYEISLEEITQEIVSSSKVEGDAPDVSTLREVEYKQGEIEIAVATRQIEYEHEPGESTVFGAGVTINTEIVIVPNGALDDHLQAFYKDRGKAGMTMGFDVYIPFGSIEGLQFTLRSPAFPITDTVVLRGVQLQITIGFPIAVGVSASIEVEFEDQPRPIKFMASGEVNTNLEIEIGGAMDGGWHEAFGIPGFVLQSAWAQVSILPYAPYIESFGLGADMDVGETQVSFDGFIEIVGRPGAFLSAKIEDLPLLDVAESYNDMVIAGARRRGRSLASEDFLEPDEIPAFLVIEELSLQLAPYDKLVEIDDFQIAFKQGLRVLGDITVLGVKHSKFDLLTTIDNRGLNFIVSIDMNLPTLYERWTRFIRVLFPNKELQELPETEDDFDLDDYIETISMSIPQIVELDIRNFNFRQFATGRGLPVINIAMRYRQETSRYGYDANLDEFGDELGDVVQRAVPWRKLVGLSECFLDMDCPDGMKCFHKEDDPKDQTCVESCGTLGSIPIYGCIPCVTSIECGHNGRNSCCDNGRCTKGDEGDFCGSCLFGRHCNSPHSGCVFGFCKACNSDWDCYWDGSYGPHCIDNRCV